MKADSKSVIGASGVQSAMIIGLVMQPTLPVNSWGFAL